LSLNFKENIYDIYSYFVKFSTSCI